MKSRMKRTFLALAVFGASLALPAAELVERIVARVNDRLITQSEYDRRLSVALKAARSSADPAKLRAQILEDMIREKLLDERATEMAVAATDEEVEAAVQRVKAQYNLKTDAEFDAALADSGMNRDDLRRQMHETITLQKVIGRDVASRMDLSDDALRVEYERRKEQFYAIPASAHVAEIVVRYSPGDDARPRRGPRSRSRRSAGRSRPGPRSPISQRNPRRETPVTRAGISGRSPRASSSRRSTSRSFRRRTSIRRPH